MKNKPMINHARSRLICAALAVLLLFGMTAVPQRSVSAAANWPANADFEQGRNVGWQESSTSGAPIVWNAGLYGPPAHSGNWMAYLGGLNSETSTLSQTLTILPDTKMVFWYRIVSVYSCGTSFGRILFNSTVVKSWDLCSASNTNTWIMDTVDLSDFAGQTGTLQFVSQTTQTNYSAWLIDDIIFYDVFLDVPMNDPFASFVKAFYDAGITSGCTTNPLMYCPGAAVTRAQMAVFLLRGIHSSSYNPPAVGGTSGFGDVPTSYWAAAWIKQLAAEGITSGCGSGNFCPEASVTRAQMAVFLLRSKYGPEYNPPPVGGSTGFGDVPTSYWAAAWIKQLVTEGITAGCGPGIYCPEAPVTRGQMAVFIVRAFGLP